VIPGTGLGPGDGQVRDLAELVRHALHTVAEQIEPGGDGLTPIRARIRAESGKAERGRTAFRYKRTGGRFCRE
jgi:hypothetical protein